MEHIPPVPISNLRMRIAFGIAIAGLLTVVWLGSGKLRFWLPASVSHDVSEIPIARNITGQELESLRTGKPLVSQGHRITETTGPAAIAEPTRRSIVERMNPSTASQKVANEPTLDGRVAFADFQEPTKGIRSPSQSLSNATDETVSSRQGAIQFAPGKNKKFDSPEDVPNATPGDSTVAGMFQEKFPEQPSVLPNLNRRDEDGADAKPLNSSEPTPAICPNPRAVRPRPDEPLAAPGNTTQQLEEIEGAATHTILESPDDKIAQVSREITTIGGETWWTISQAVYGDGRLFRELYWHNQDSFPDYESIPPGSVIDCPSVDQLKRLSPQPESAETKSQDHEPFQPEYITGKNECVFDIARQRLGQASRYVEIIELNRKTLPLDTTHLTPLPSGLRLRVPAR